jgi:dephospho-CoA kinase
MLILGLTGGIGAGKSLVLNFLSKNYNSYICETDRLAHELMKSGTEINRRITNAFGNGILNDDKSGDIDRAKLGPVVFSNPEKLDLLNSIVHPGVKEYILADIEEKRKSDIDIYVIEAALLLQDGYDKICDRIWHIWADRESRISRLMANRGYSYEKCVSVIENQPGDDFYIERADFTINNNSSPEKLFDAVKVELNKLGISGIIG